MCCEHVSRLRQREVILRELVDIKSVLQYIRGKTGCEDSCTRVITNVPELVESLCSEADLSCTRVDTCVVEVCLTE